MLHGAGDPDEGESAFFFEFGDGFGGARVGEGAFFECDHRDGGELEAFGCVEGHEGDGSGIGVHRVGVGDEGDGFEVGADEGEEWGSGRGNHQLRWHGRPACVFCGR